MKPHLRITVQTLLDNGSSQREIERVTGVDRKTIRRIGREIADAEANSPGVATGSEGRESADPGEQIEVRSLRGPIFCLSNSSSSGRRRGRSSPPRRTRSWWGGNSIGIHSRGGMVCQEDILDPGDRAREAGAAEFDAAYGCGSTSAL